ncbi:Threonine/homoserine/homoserine lactone efflux protein [Tranquillimonas rosea]|uniref:Threonine/homoserine/homoserine lactone efflux protein n=1 Tax=Tranquillimonas rosea TaxID=641238 RepID=A0A1H9X5K5_9RHOB|nr:LysE family translocator [Tranquillimonas rosea]SES41321.1 Threonine/homoserine/homoserine lactone efflux protein [Tranquillimonas rosea]
MTASPMDFALYAGALLVLFLTPGPVWVGLMARSLSGGFQAAWPLALGVVVGDILWPLLAILGVTWLVSVFSGFLLVLKGVACLVFIGMGIAILRSAGASISADGRLTRPGKWAGFVAGLAVILGNPKAILFYMGMLPGFFDLGDLRTGDIAAIIALSAAVPLIGNLVLALSIDRVRRLLSSPRALRRTNVTAGLLLIGVGCVIPFT